MTEYAITPYEGAGEIRLGMLREEVRKLFTEQTTLFRRSANSVNASDHFQKAGIICSYDSTGACESIEFVSPAKPTYEGKSLISMKTVLATKLLDTKDDIKVMDERTVSSDALGIGLFFRLKKVASVIVFVKGYYDAVE
jgi:hypothetical protein